MDKTQLVEGTEVLVISEKRMGNVFAVNEDMVTVVLRGFEDQELVIGDYSVNDLQYFIK